MQKTTAMRMKKTIMTMLTRTTHTVMVMKITPMTTSKLTMKA